MKLKKLIAAVLPLALILLCSCENTEIVDVNGNPLSREEKKAYANAELIFEKAETLIAEMDNDNIHFTQLCYVGELGDDIFVLPNTQDIVKADGFNKAMNYYVGDEVDGYFAIDFNTYGELALALWSSSLDSELIGVFPADTDLADLPEKNLGEISRLHTFEVSEELLNDSNISTANSNARLVFQNVESYMKKVQTAGAKIMLSNDLEFSIIDTYSTDNSRSYGVDNNLSGVLDLSEKEKNFPYVDSGDVIDDKAVQNALRYYQGGEDGGVAIVLLDENNNPVATLWARDEKSSFVGAFPTQYVSRGFHENGDTIKTADISQVINE